MSQIHVVNLGRRPYGPVLELQRSLVRARLEGAVEHDLLLLVEHDPVVTLGRSTRPSSLPVARPLLEARGFEVFEVERGGDVTVHAPGQLVGYPILDLTGFRSDLHWYLRRLEESLIVGLEQLGISAERNPGLTGVWTGGRKIASIGVHVKRWITLHGFALNVSTDLSVFDQVVPCGIDGVVMTRVQDSLGRTSESAGELWDATVRAIVDGLGSAFDRSMVASDPAELGGVLRDPAM